MSLVNDGEDVNKIPNRELVIRFFQMLTTGFHASTADGVLFEGDAEKAVLEATKHWRGELWEAFHLIESRLVPRPTGSPRPKYAQIVSQRRLIASAEPQPPGSLHPVSEPASD